jgi:SAM-dependent methyltransferase
MKFKDSALAHKYLDGLKGIEIGGSAHNPFHVNSINVDYTDDMNTIFKQAEFNLCGEKLKVDVIADAVQLPFKNEQFDFVLSSHLIEHLFDPIAGMKEWIRVIKKGGYIFTICPLKEQVPGEIRPVTKLSELIDRHEGRMKPEEVVMWANPAGLNRDFGMPNCYIQGIVENHFTVFDLALFIEICEYLKLKIVETQAVDDKVGNGFTVVVKK